MHPVVLASVTDSLANTATSIINDLGLPGVFVLMLLESACVPIPSEATMLFAGFNVANHTMTLWQVVLVGVVGNLVGSWIAYGVGYFGRVEVLERVLRIKREHLERADRWFERYGDRAVFFSRLLPVVRTFISLPAGAARMPFWRFTVLTLAGCVPWVLALGVIGRVVGHRWTSWRDGLHYVDYAVVVIAVALFAYYMLRWWRGRRDVRPADATSP